jgi:hypothetical protein
MGCFYLQKKKAHIPEGCAPQIPAVTPDLAEARESVRKCEETLLVSG